MLQGQFDVIDAPQSPPGPAIASSASEPAGSASNPSGTQPPVTEKSGDHEPSIGISSDRRDRITIGAGDTLAKIAARLYGDPEKWRTIAKANPGLDVKRLKPGRVIILPDGARRRK
jgi:5'-nucleotidase